MEIDRETAQRVLAVVDQGLTAGLGKPQPGKMCVEAAVCYALGMPHGDDPVCVSRAVRNFKIVLNDANWSSRMVRAQGLRRVAIAQLGSDSISAPAFAAAVAVPMLRQLLPLALRGLSNVSRIGSAGATELESIALACETAAGLGW